MGYPMMKCGHVANSKCSQKNGVVYEPAIDSCVICDCIEQVEAVPYEGRIAKCAHCQTFRPSSTHLAFFEYKGVGSPRAENTCKKCRFHKIAHSPDVMAKNPNLKCTEFEPVGAFEFDEFYCGCRGWD